MTCCPHCASSTVDEQGRRTALGYRTFRCSTCQRSFNERTGTAFNFLEFVCHERRRRSVMR
jgi:transposase-like protein